MRKLNVRQKKLLDRAWESGVRDVDELDQETYNLFIEMNDHETIYQNADRYLMDKTMDSLHGFGSQN